MSGLTGWHRSFILYHQKMHDEFEFRMQANGMTNSEWDITDAANPG